MKAAWRFVGLIHGRFLRMVNHVLKPERYIAYNALLALGKLYMAHVLFATYHQHIGTILSLLIRHT